MRVVISSGHGKNIAGAVGIINEVTEARRVVSRVVTLLRQAGVIVTEFHDDVSRTVADNLNAIVNFHNSCPRDIDVSIHFNDVAGDANAQPTGIGTECLYKTQMTLAADMAGAISAASGLRNRGGLLHTGLAFLNRTTQPAILIEVCFVNAPTDVRLYQNNFEAICAAIAATLAGKTITATPTATELYRVRKAWDDVASQIGAFADYSNAIAKANDNPGYWVFNSAGQALYGVDVQIPARHWAQGDADYLASIGVTLSETRFDETATRGEVVALLAKYDRARHK